MNIQDIREIMGLTQAQVADELGVPKQEVIDCEENGETYLLLQYISAFPINPAVMKDPDVDPFLPSFDQNTPGERMRQWREENDLSAAVIAAAIGISEEDLEKFENGEGAALSRRRGEEIEKKTGMNRKWLMYGDGRNKGAPRLSAAGKKAALKAEKAPRVVRNHAPNKPAGVRIKEARKEAGLSREELADLLGLSVSRITQMESGYIKDKKADHVLSRIEAVSGAPKKEDPKDAGIRLRETRKAAGLSVKEAAEIVGLKHTTLAHLESGYITGKRADELIEMLEKAPKKSEHEPFNAKEAGARIRDERVRAGLSQKELGTIMRIPTSRITHIELGNVTEAEAERILKRIAGKPLREIKNRRIKPTEQKILGSNIRDARIALDMSQKALGDLLQLPQTRISMIEHGKVDEATAKKILGMLNAMIENQQNEAAIALERDGAQITIDSLLADQEAEAAPARKRRRNATPIQPEWGKKLQEARIAAGLSQKAVGDLLGFSQGRVSYMEQGKVDTPTAEKVLEIIKQSQQKS